MPVTSVTCDAEALTLTASGDYPVAVERLWGAWLDPRQIERFWGPPGFPATFSRHDMTPGGRSRYFMTGPDGEQFHGYWTVHSVDSPRSFTVTDGFAHADGTVDDDMPTSLMRIDFEADGDRSRFVAVTTFADRTAMDRLIGMGMQEGLTLALGQLDGVLADRESFGAGRAIEVRLIDDTTVRTSRVVRSSVDQVWAHHDPVLLRQWLLGPGGWSMPTCDVATEVGQTYRHEWLSEDGGTRFGFEGELLEVDAPHRTVTTERMVGTEGPSTINDLTLRPVGAGTLVSIVITYPSRELRDQILATGMTDGMEASYARLERVLGIEA